MRLIPLNEAQESFVEIEILGRHLDDDDPEVRAIVEILAEHFERSGGKTLAVPNAEVVKSLILDAINGLDDSISSKRTEREHSLNLKDARRLHAAGSSLLKAVTRHQRTKGLGESDLIRGMGDAREDCAQKLTALKHGDPVRIGGKGWEVWRNASDRGAMRSIEVFVVRAGSKGTKLYKLVVKDVEQCRVDVCLVNGMGDVIQGPVASGALP